jgi:glutamate formiminotransferase / formiminotetrahydrofolate cyclodeaminase
MAKLVECVPNFSEGRDRNVIKQITDVIEAVEGVTLKNVDPGAEMNRVVVTFIGEPGAAVEAAFRSIRKAIDVIDMSRHHGTHPRMGACDVCPFVPVSEVTMEECVALTHRLGKRVGEELAIPVYMYDRAAARPERQNLAVVRRGEYEGLEAKLRDPEWKPDYGPAAFNAKAGAVIIGAREFLIAYNVDLNSRCKDHATDIAFEIREKGRSARRGNLKPFYYRGELVKHKEGQFFCGSCDFAGPDADALFAHTQDAHGYNYPELCALHDQNPAKLVGQSALKPGMFPHCRAIGWEVPQFDRVQISINLTDYHVTPPHTVLEKARELAVERGIVVTGSEIVGLVPYPALIESGKFYLRAQKRSTGIPYDDILRTAVQSMGLKDVASFDIAEKVIGYPKPDPNALVQKRTDEFVHEVSRESPAPGGGSVAALASSLGAALASMVANLTAGKGGYEAVEEEMIAVAEKAQDLKDKLLAAVDDDTKAFNAYMDALRLPKSSPEEKTARKAAMQAGLKKAVAVPLQTAKHSLEALELCRAVAQRGNRNSASDGGVGAYMAHAGLEGAVLNVLINLKDIEDADYVAEMRAACAGLQEKGKALLCETSDAVLAAIGSKK